MILVSFYTDNWLYPQHAARLKRECMRYGLQADIKRLSGHPSGWLHNTQLKARFIRECLKTHAEIVWVDADSSIIRKPDMFKRSLGADMALARHATMPRHWHVGVMAFRRSPGVLSLIDDWVERAEAGDSTDEAAFEEAWVNRQADFQVRPLPPGYHGLPSGGRYLPGTVIAMGISQDETKMAMKARRSC